jgi:acyl-CoA thioester hydrolase
VVWHGSYALYFEDAREAFGEKFGLTYLGYIEKGYYAPLVDLKFQYKHPLKYGSKPRIDIVYRPTQAAKVVFDYEIRDTVDDTLIATGTSIQVFMDLNYELVWESPQFYKEWQERWDVFNK